jgi:hypothetical protein
MWQVGMKRPNPVKRLARHLIGIWAILGLTADGPAIGQERVAVPPDIQAAQGYPVATEARVAGDAKHTRCHDPPSASSRFQGVWVGVA